LIDGLGFDFDLSYGLPLLLLLLGMSGLARRAFRSSERGSFFFYVRVLVIGTLLLLIGEPVLSLTYEASRKPLIAVVVDNSESLRIASGDRTRTDVVTGILEDTVWNRLADRARLRWFAVDVETVEFRTPQLPNFDGPGTDLAQGLKTVTKELRNEGLVGILLASDGANNLGVSPETLASGLEAPVHTVLVGAKGAPADLSLTWWGTEPLGYVGRPLAFQVTLRVSGQVKTRLPLLVSSDSTVVARKVVEVSPGEQTVELVVVPDRSGVVEYEVRVSGVPDEQELRNNRVVVRTRVLPARSDVLLAGPPSADLAYLRRTIEADSNYVVEFVHVLTGAIPSRLRRATEASDPPDVIILHDLSVSPGSGRMADYVRGGGALLVVGGRRSALEQTERGDGLLPLRGGAFESLPVRVEVPADASSHPILRSGMVDPQIWRSLPPLSGMNPISRVRDDARVLLRSSISKDPIAVVSQYGGGKVAVFAGRSYWRHGLMSLGYDRASDAPAAFWRSCIRWLSAREDISRLRVETDRSLYRSGEPVKFRAQLFDALLYPVDGARVGVEVLGAAPRTTTLRSVGRGHYEGRIRGLPQGSHTYRVSARSNGQESESVMDTLTVGRYSLEFENLSVDGGLLSAISRNSGGKVVDPDQIAQFLDELVLLPQPHRVSIRRRLLGVSWPFWLAAIALCAEWAWRRRRGMV